MSNFKDLTVEQFIDVTASEAPAPGGGSVSALAGSLGAALAEMVANLTIGKIKYIEVEDEMKELAAAAAEIRTELTAAIQKDTESFHLYMTALKLPKETEEEKAVRKEALQSSLKEAAKVPLEAAEAAVKIFPIAKVAVVKGNKKEYKGLRDNLNKVYDELCRIEKGSEISEETLCLICYVAAILKGMGGENNAK